jgi:hypothetical protein
VLKSVKAQVAGHGIHFTSSSLIQKQTLH